MRRRYLSRLPTTPKMRPSSGNSPVLSLECTRSPLSVNSKQPPPEGTSLRLEICCLYSERIRLAKLTALGS